MNTQTLELTDQELKFIFQCISRELSFHSEVPQIAKDLIELIKVKIDLRTNFEPGHKINDSFYLRNLTHSDHWPVRDKIWEVELVYKGENFKNGLVKESSFYAKTDDTLWGDIYYIDEEISGTEL